MDFHHSCYIMRKITGLFMPFGLCQWSMKNGGNSHGSREPTIHGDWDNLNIYVDHTIMPANWSQCLIPHWQSYWHLGLYSLSGRTSYRKISWSLEAARFGFKLFQSLWHLTGTSAAQLPRCLSNVRGIRSFWHPISRLRDFTRFGGKTSYRLVNRGPG